MPAKTHGIVVLDFGGVLLRLRDPIDTFGIDMHAAEFNRMWLLSSSVRALECGQTDIDEFAVAAVREFALDYGSDEFLRRFELWPDRLFDGVIDLLDAIGRDHRLALLSNTNPVHWNRPDIAAVLEPRFDRLFLSWQTGHLKPDAVAFEDVIDFFGIEPGGALFLDDNPLNIEAAATAGFDARLTRGYDELRYNLEAAGII